MNSCQVLSFLYHKHITRNYTACQDENPFSTIMSKRPRPPGRLRAVAGSINRLKLGLVKPNLDSAQNGIQFETILISNAENGDFKHIEYPFVYKSVLLDVHVFDCDVTGVPCKGAVCECDQHLKFVLYCANNKKYYEYRFRKQSSPTWFSQCLSHYLSIIL